MMPTRGRRPNRPNLRRRVALVAAGAATAVLATTLPAQATTTSKTNTLVQVDGNVVQAVRWYAWGNAGDVDGTAELLLDQPGGAKFSGKISNKYIAGRHVRYACTITYGPQHKTFTWQTSRYWVSGRDTKSWNWPREYQQWIRDNWSSIWFDSTLNCRITVG